MPSRRILLSGVGIALTGTLGHRNFADAASMDASEENQKQQEQEQARTVTENATVTVNTDRTGIDTIVADATVPDGGFIVVSFTEAGPPIASSTYLAPGTHENVHIERSENDYVEKGDTALYDIQLARDSDNDQTFEALTDEYYDGDRSLQAITMSLTEDCELIIETKYP